MKIFISTWVLGLLFSTNLLLSDDTNINFGTSLQVARINNNFALISGMKIGVNLNNNLFAGIALYSNALYKHQIEAVDTEILLRPTFEINYYGIEGEYYFNPESTLGISTGALIGVSNIFFTAPLDNENNSDIYFPDYRNGMRNIILIPSLNINLNLKQFYKIVLGVNYRLLPGFEYNPEGLVSTNDDNNYSISTKDVEGFSVNLTVRFGSF